MNTDPTAFTSWVQVAALGILVLGGVALKWIGTMKKDGADTREKVDQLVTAVTTTNGGSTAKDQWDRVERKLDDHLAWSTAYAEDTASRLDALESPGKRFVDDPQSAESPQES